MQDQAQNFLLKNTHHFTIACYDKDAKPQRKNKYVVVTYNFIGSEPLCKSSLRFIKNKYHTQCWCFEKTAEFEIQKDVHF